MLTKANYKTHNHLKFLVNYHFAWIPKRRKKVLTGEIAIRTRQIFVELAIEKGCDMLALEVALLPHPFIRQCETNRHPSPCN